MKKLTGFVIASAVASAFVAAPISSVFADSSTSNMVKCDGVNKCKGQSACKTADNACQGMNSCKGKGFVMAQSEKKCDEMKSEMEVSEKKAEK